MNELSLVFKGRQKHGMKHFLLGNGSMGAMSYGWLRKEKIELNLDKLWSGTGRRKKTKIQMWMGAFAPENLCWRV